MHLCRPYVVFNVFRRQMQREEEGCAEVDVKRKYIHKEICFRSNLSVVSKVTH